MAGDIDCNEALRSIFRTYLEQEDARCESRHGCDNPPDVMVWVAHHRSDCNYTGYRCYFHLNHLVQEAVRTMRRIDRMQRKGRQVFCYGCDQRIVIGALRDHVRWVQL